MTSLSERMTIVVIAACVATTVARWRSALDVIAVAELRAIPPVGEGADTFATPVDKMVAAIVSNDPFRLSNAPATVAFDPRSDMSVPAPQARAIARQPRPVMVLRGIIGGPPWQAIVDGLPGQSPGTLVRAGMTFDQITVRSVMRDTVVMQGADTTWTLTLGGART